MSNLSLPVLLHEISERGDIISPEKEAQFLDFEKAPLGARRSSRFINM